MAKKIKDNYDNYVKNVTPVTNVWKNIFNAFWIGGLICLLGQFLLDFFQNMGFKKETAGIDSSVRHSDRSRTIFQTGKICGCRNSCSDYGFCQFRSISGHRIPERRPGIRRRLPYLFHRRPGRSLRHSVQLDPWDYLLDFSDIF